MCVPGMGQIWTTSPFVEFDVSIAPRADIFGEDELREACEGQIKTKIGLENILMS